MLGNHICLPIHVTGTLAANVTFTWTVPFDCTVKSVSAVASNDSDATMILGISTDTDSIIASTTIGDSGTPVTKTRADFASTNERGSLAKDEILVLTVDYDGSAGTAAANLSVVITLLEG